MPGWGEDGAVTSVGWQIPVCVWSHWQVASRSSDVNFTKNYTLLYIIIDKLGLPWWRNGVSQSLAAVRLACVAAKPRKFGFNSRFRRLN